jgi:hypothetical protein
MLTGSPTPTRFHFTVSITVGDETLSTTSAFDGRFLSVLLASTDTLELSSDSRQLLTSVFHAKFGGEPDVDFYVGKWRETQHRLERESAEYTKRITPILRLDELSITG